MSREAIDGVNGQFIAAWNDGDVARAVRLAYGEDSTILPPGMPAIRGLEGIQRFWEGARAMGVGRATLETVRLDQLGDGQACEIGNYSLQMPASGGQTTTERGKYVVIWKRQPDGAWKWHVDIWNGNG